ncbi:MAG: hypothetical protein ACLU2J_04635 [Clostridia bacterium]
MTFSEQLNKYIKQIECSSKDLVISSGLTSSVISRYRRGDRTPSLKSKQLELTYRWFICFLNKRNEYN